jgi:hypothetical protein
MDWLQARSHRKICKSNSRLIRFSDVIVDLFVKLPACYSAMTLSTAETRWFSLKQAGRYSGLTERTLRNYADAGMLKFHRIIQPGAARGTVRIDRLELDALIENSVAPASVLKMNERHLIASTGGAQE